MNGPTPAGRRNLTVVITAAIIVVALLALSLGAAALLGPRIGHSSGSFATPTPDTAGIPAGLEKFYTQKLRWTDCDSARCTRIRVPIDYANPAGATLTLAVKLYPAEGRRPKGHRHDDMLFVNPGGPGGSALEYVDRLHTDLPRSVRDAYALVGIDPRGVGRSTPLTCLNAKQFDKYTASDPDPDTPAEINDYQQGIRDMGQACERNSGLLAAHVSTEEAARDFDVARAVLGQKHFNWLGASYGTQLGATYATLFSQRVGRMVLDGAIDPSLSSVDSALGQAQGFQQAFESYVRHCIKRSNCPKKWTSIDDANTDVGQLFTSLDAEPLPTGTKRKLTEGLAFYGIAVTLYAKDNWSYLTSALTKAFKGDGSALLDLSDFYFDRTSGGRYSDNSGQVFNAITCLDAPGGTTVAETESLVAKFQQASPVFGRAMAWGTQSCANWPIAATHPQQPVSAPDVQTPIVVVGTTRDPATPYAWAKALATQLQSAVLLTRDGDGHTGYLMGNACVDRAVNAYLIHGTVPKAGRVCR